MVGATSEYQRNRAIPPGKVPQERPVTGGIATSARSRRRSRSLEPSDGNIADDASLGPTTGLRFKNVLRVDASHSLGIDAELRLHLFRRDAAGRAASFTGTRSSRQDRAGVHTFVEHLPNCLKRRAFMPTSRATAERYSGLRGRECALVPHDADRSRER